MLPILADHLRLVTELAEQHHFKMIAYLAGMALEESRDRVRSSCLVRTGADEAPPSLRR
ncbi:hypothetical protein [Jiella endophytica]|uniref:hypothetical protein n=1 Tax=Jiella endophytica TaxID=2558362 RepID=UPI001430D5F8|nr:hypothetical protein [Jiella endophytica]